MDRIFTRVGASDDLSQGQSTFMVEMTEVSHILRNATNNSLVILDEIGRGTSTYDGISLAWSIVEYIHENIGCKTLFATHYHELTDLEADFTGVKNYSVAVKEQGENIVFLRKIVSGGADKSYGIHVAKLASLPEDVIKRATSILKDLEKNHINTTVQLENRKTEYTEHKESIDVIKEAAISIEPYEQLSFESFDKNNLIQELTSLDIINMTPMEAMNVLYNLQIKAKK
jgi:DNA mismatch repair protein MutS